jgi:hypothetical protein
MFRPGLDEMTETVAHLMPDGIKAKNGWETWNLVVSCGIFAT